MAAIDGSRDDLASRFREFVRLWMSENSESRKPYVFYNTWNFQERNFSWHKRPYLESMTQERILAEVDVAHRLGIDVFVLDTGWFERTGDWRMNPARFPDHLRAVKRKLDGYGMKLGLWFDNAAAISSDALAKHKDCVMRRGEKEPEPKPVWWSEAAYRMCLVSRYWKAFADELIRLVNEVGVTYFKWDAIEQYACDAAGHEHGTEANSAQERNDAFAFRLPGYLTKIVDRLCAACPEAIVDLDMTEKGRCLGLGFLAAGKLFLINNGPYHWDFNIPKENVTDGNANLLFFPGRARPWFMRFPLSFDKWIPSNLLLTHYLPDDPAASQDVCVASLVLGQNGIWVDLLSISQEGIERIGRALGAYKHVSQDVAAAPPVRRRRGGASPEWHEKINPQTGRGVVCVFANWAGSYAYVTENVVRAGCSLCPAGVQIDRQTDGRVKIVAKFEGEEAGKMIVFGEHAATARRPNGE